MATVPEAVLLLSFLSEKLCGGETTDSARVVVRVEDATWVLFAMSKVPL